MPISDPDIKKAKPEENALSQSSRSSNSPVLGR